MKPVLRQGIYVFIVLIIVYSCKKEYSCENCRETNQPPVADAGKDAAIILPVDSVLLDGSASTDPDGTIGTWNWKKISGPSSFLINNFATEKTIVKNLVSGSYQFELMVTDDKGLSAKDTVKITVTTVINNRPPVADAGPDISITLPVSTININGSQSTDPDNNITSYQWRKISGPSTFTITSTNAIQTPVINLVAGVYEFELKVTDAGGLFDTDTVQAQVQVAAAPTLPSACDNTNRPSVSARLGPFGTLSQARAFITVASSENKIVFAGGIDATGRPSSRVDIYDFQTGTWSTSELSIARFAIAAVTAGNKIFFAGGETGDGTIPVDAIDIYDITTKTWSVSRLSVPGHSIAGAVVGNKIVFAGGDGGIYSWDRQKRVDILDLNTNTWSTASLSEEKRGGHAAITAGNKIYFAGGETMIVHGSTTWEYNWTASNVIDIYDNTSNTWSTSTMMEGKLSFASTIVNNKIIWAGGQTGGYDWVGSNVRTSCNVEIKDLVTGTSTVEHLSEPFGNWAICSGQNAVIKDNKIIFYRPNGNNRGKFDIYDLTNKTWSIGVLPQPIPASASVIAVNNTIYIAGGEGSNQVWKLEF